jgi:nitrate reductase beta subunit
MEIVLILLSLCISVNWTTGHIEPVILEEPSSGNGMPTAAQLGCLYRISYYLTYLIFQPIHLVCIDGRTQNLYVLAGQNEEIEFEVTPSGEVL